MVKWAQRIEEAILLGIVLLNVFDFLELLPDHLNFIKNIISWTVLGYLVYKISLTEIFFGNKSTHADLLILASYFLLIVKNFVAVASAAIEESPNLGGFYAFVLQHANSFEYVSFLTGGILLLALSAYMAFRIEVRSPSVIAVLHEEGLPENLGSLLARASSIFLVLTAFFIIVFNLIFEWLAIAVDAPLLMLGVFVYLFTIIRHHKNFNAEGLIFKLGNFGDEFYRKFIQLFHYKETMLLGLLGVLVLHLLTDIGIFIIPYIFGIHDILYFSQLGAYHDALPQLFLSDIKGQGIISIISLFFLYLFNLIAMLFFLILPGFIWYRLFSNKPMHVSRFALGPILGSLIAFIFTPAFSIKLLNVPGLAGVDIQTKSILVGKSILDSIMAHSSVIWAAALFSIITMIAILFFEMEMPVSRIFFLISVIAGTVFFGYYVFYYFSSVYAFYAGTISILWKNRQIFAMLYFVLFAGLLAIFYLSGFLAFIYEVIKNHMYYRNMEET